MGDVMAQDVIVIGLLSLTAQHPEILCAAA